MSVLLLKGLDFFIALLGFVGQICTAVAAILGRGLAGGKFVAAPAAFLSNLDVTAHIFAF